MPMEFERKLLSFKAQEQMKMRMTRNAFNYLVPPLLLRYKNATGTFFFNKVCVRVIYLFVNTLLMMLFV